MWLYKNFVLIVGFIVYVTFLCVVEAEAENNGIDEVEGSLASTVKLLQEQVEALLQHRQEDYNKLEESLKQSIDKNTEMVVLKNEIKQLRKELSIVRSTTSSSTTTTNGLNEAKNERLRLRWLVATVSELQSELAEVLAAKNTSEELAERARLRSEIELLRADVAGMGKGVRDLTARLASLEANLGGLRLDIVAVKQRNSHLTRNYADIASQMSSVQIEMAAIKCDDNGAKTASNSEHNIPEIKNEISESSESISEQEPRHTRHATSRLSFQALHRLDERMNKMEHKIAMVSRKRALLEKRVVYEDKEVLSHRVHILESIGRDLTEKVRNVSHELNLSNKANQMALVSLATNQSEFKRELSRLDINAARKAAELSLTREELSNLKKAVQALSVSASKLQEKSDLQQDVLYRLNSSVGKLDLDRAENLTKVLEHVEDEYRSMVDALPGNCEQKDGLTLLAPGPGAPLLAACRKGWIVVGRRIDGTVDFDRSWNDYATGFGSPLNEFWAGNEALHRLSQDNCTRLRIELNDIDGNYWVANYEEFSIDDEDNGYRIRIGGFSGNATDAMSYQNHMRFSAKDRDLDISSTDCAANYHGGWWFSHCQHANLNGRYSLGLTWYRSDVNQWMAVATAELLVQRKEQCL